jgi:hypothetical protein
MADGLGECIGQICAIICFEGIVRLSLTIIVCITYTFVIPHRAAIVRFGRGVQNVLHLPSFMRIFADKDPGMLDRELIVITGCVSACGISTGLGGLITLAAKTWWKVMLVAGVAVPACIMIVLWIVLVLARRRLNRSPAVATIGQTEKDVEGQTEEEEQAAREADVKAWTKWIWETPSLRFYM